MARLLTEPIRLELSLDDPGLDTSGEGACGAFEPNAIGPSGEMDASPQHFFDGGGQGVSTLFIALWNERFAVPSQDETPGNIIDLR
jgi:hypothetical protein